MIAVTTPTGMSPSEPRDEVGVGEQGRAAERREREDEPRGRADEQPHDVRHDEPDEADEPADRDRGRGHQRGEGEQDPPLAPDVDAEVGGRLLAEQQAVERPRPEQDQRRSPMSDDRQRAGQALPGRVREAAEQVAEDLAEGGARTGTSPSPARPRAASRPRSRSAAGWSAGARPLRRESR